ncbi:hypothetical protein [Burkholderia plantarii]|nr:hypothetical protein [Burkholderia plantarii]
MCIRDRPFAVWLPDLGSNQGPTAVSYTHLDVYKRQQYRFIPR